MVTHETIRSADGTELATNYYPGNDARGILVVSHGLGEHAGCYVGFAKTLASTPDLVDVLTFDFRGHGQSAGKRGFVRDYSDLLDDLDVAIDFAATHHPGAPLFLLGHSNGGQVALHAVLKDTGRIDGLVLSNPSLRVSAKVPSHKYYAGLVLRRFAPRVTLSSTVLDEALTRDPISLAERKLDTLRHGKISAPLFFGMVEGGEEVLQHAGDIHLPVLMILGGSDTVVDPKTSRLFFDRLGSHDKTLKLHPEMLHEPLNEIGREEVVEEIVSWISHRLASMAVGESAAN